MGTERIPLEARFWSKVDVRRPRQCWLWQGGITGNGYGALKVNGKMEGAHRVSYFLTHGEWPSEGMQLDHLCRHPLCVNPRHLEVVTSAENTMRSPVAPAAVNARKTNCVRGHPYSEANTWRGARGERHCRLCWQIRKVERAEELTR